MKAIEDKVIEYLDNIIVMDDDGRQWLSVEYNEMEEKIRKLFKGNAIPMDGWENIKEVESLAPPKPHSYIFKRIEL